MKHLGDITKMTGATTPIVDIVTGGSPCQDLSVAGKREGLAGERSGLYMEQIRVIKEMREEDRKNGRTDQFCRPRYMVWENVPGTFSSNGGEDLRAVLEEAARVSDPNAVIPRLEEGQKWTNAGCIVGQNFSIAWKLHDAQYWGVPQRRRRLCMLCDFNGWTAPEILFDPQYRGEAESATPYETVADTGAFARSEVQPFGESVSRDSEPSGEEGERVAEGTEGCPGESSYTLKIRGGVDVDSKGKRAGKGALIQEEMSGTLGVSQDQTLIQTHCIDQGAGKSSNQVLADMGPTLSTTHYGAPAVCYGISPYASNAMLSDNPNSGIYEAETSRTTR